MKNEDRFAKKILHPNRLRIHHLCLGGLSSRRNRQCGAHAQELLSLFRVSQGDYGQSHKFCAADTRVPDFYSYGRTMLVTFKSDAFVAGNGMSLTYQVAGKKNKKKHVFTWHSSCFSFTPTSHSWMTLRWSELLVPSSQVVVGPTSRSTGT